MPYATVSVGTSATLIVSQRTNRVHLVISNPNSETLFLGQDDSVTTSNFGIALLSGGSFSDFGTGSTTAWLGDVYGVLGTGSQAVGYWEVIR